MYSAYEYLFYRCYRLSLKLFDRHDSHLYNATMMLSLLVVLNTISFAVLLGAFIELPTRINSNMKYIGGTIALAIGISNYGFFRFDGRYIEIIDRYKNETTYNEKKGRIVLVTFLIGSLIFLFLSGVVAFWVRV